MSEGLPHTKTLRKNINERVVAVKDIAQDTKPDFADT